MNSHLKKNFVSLIRLCGQTVPASNSKPIAIPDVVGNFTKASNIMIKKLLYTGILILIASLNCTSQSVDRTKKKIARNGYPINFDELALERAKVDSSMWKTKTFAFDAEILKIDTSNKNKPLLKAKLGSDHVVWVFDMTNSNFKVVGNKIRFIGYILPTDLNSTEITSEFSIMIISYGSLELSTKTLFFSPGFKKQIDEWANGRIPITN